MDVTLWCYKWHMIVWISNKQFVDLANKNSQVASKYSLLPDKVLIGTAQGGSERCVIVWDFSSGILSYSRKDETWARKWREKIHLKGDNLLWFQPILMAASTQGPWTLHSANSPTKDLAQTKAVQSTTRCCSRLGASWTWFELTWTNKA